MIEGFASDDPYVRTADAVLRMLFADHYARNFSVELWDGSRVPSTGASKFTLKINSPGALRLALRPPVDLNAGRALAANLLDCEGDLEAAMHTLYQSINAFRRSSALKLYSLLLRLPRARLPKLREARLRGKLHSVERDQAAIGFHYDQPVAFYRSFLGEQLVYSCAYFDDGVDTLEEAQTAKIDYVLRKLRLLPQERLLDIGCGWGTLVLRAAKAFNARVVGVTLSRSQYEEGNRRIREAGLQDRASIELRDYRQLKLQSFDKIASIGMFEHVGRPNLPEYFNRAFELLRPGGLFLNHGIAEQNPGRPGGRVTGFMERFIFPDGELVAIGDALQIAEHNGFEVRDVENLREHYTRTLRCWIRNLQANKEHAISCTDEQTYRAWRLYMAGSAQGFAIGRLGVFQSVLVKPHSDGRVDLPPTRRNLYTTERPSSARYK
ncbi:MAG: cyclopropane-fatty-acyl-phospholipid synthase family protein [Candidatus Eremiobacteraeota bacterium]|nr:cyclopropane-fatty-acyl-phospholipid synthase family protein [Candidatus Eremiobacteraeota bacterium]